MIDFHERIQIPLPRDTSLASLHKLVSDLNAALSRICDALPIQQPHLTDATALTATTTLNTLLSRLESAGVLKTS